MKTLFTVITLLFSFVYSYSQQTYLIIDVENPENLSLCQNSDTLHIQVRNPFDGTTSNTVANITLPNGVSYLNHYSIPSNSISLGTQTGNTYAFNYPDIEEDSIFDLFIVLEAGCDLRRSFDLGGSISPQINFSFMANALSWNQSVNTNSLSFFEPNLDFSTITNQAKFANIGDTVERCYTIINNGNTKVFEFTFQNLLGSSLNILELTESGNPVTFNQTGDLVTFLMDSSFLSGGLDIGETITLCEKVVIQSCNDVESFVEVYWGCSSDTCQRGVNNTNIVFADLNPNISYSHSSVRNNCFGPGGEEIRTFKLWNDGVGTAHNVKFNLRQYHAQNGNRGFIDTSEFNIYHSQNPSVDVFDHNQIDAINFNANYAFLNEVNPNGARPVSYIDYVYPELDAGDTLTFEFIYRKGCDTNIHKTARRYVGGLFFQAWWENQCGIEYNFSRKNEEGNNARYYRHSITADKLIIGGNEECNITTVSGNTSFSASFLVNNQEYPVQDQMHLQLFEDSIMMVFELPLCAEFSPTTGNGVYAVQIDGSIRQASRVVSDPANGIVKAFFPGPTASGSNFVPFYQDKSSIYIDLISKSCADCGSSNTGTVTLSVYYRPNPSCNVCNIGMGLAESKIEFNCTICPSDITFTDLCVYRQNLGLPDNNDDGTPDAAWTPAGLSKVRTDRVIYGDTIFAQATAENYYFSNLNYIYLELEVSDTSLEFLGCDSIIFQKLSFPFTTQKFGGAINSNYYSVVSGNSEKHLIEIEIASIPGIPNGFNPSNNKIILKNRLRVNHNIGNLVKELNYFGRFFGSNNSGPTPTVETECNEQEAQMTLLGFSIYNRANNYYDFHSCNNQWLYQDLWLQIGPCCNNDRGGNFFPFEYRHFLKVDTIVVESNQEYTVVNNVGSSIYYRTAYSASPNNFLNSGWRQLNATKTFNTATGKWRYTFPYNGLYDNTLSPLNTLYPSDDGSRSHFRFQFRPTCNTAEGLDTIWYINSVIKKADQLAGSENVNVNDDIHSYDLLYYERPNFFFQSFPSQTQYRKDSIVTWDLKINNQANNSDANLFWMKELYPSSLEIISIKNKSTGNTLSTVNGFYQLGTFNAKSDLDLEVTARINSCAPDSLVFGFGWDCDAYPTSIANYPCEVETYSLTAIPLSPSIKLTLTSLEDTSDLCQEVTYEATIENKGSGNAIEMLYEVFLVDGMNYVPGSAEIAYPINTGFSPFADPDSSVNLIYWSQSDLNAIINKGLSSSDKKDSSTFKIRFRVITSCPEYTSGQKISNRIKGLSASCYTPFERSGFPTNALYIESAIPDYGTEIIVDMENIKPCEDSTFMKVMVVNNGGAPTATTDSVHIQLPKGIRYAGNYTPQSNIAPTVGRIYNENIYQNVVIGLDVMPMGDTAIFQFDVYGIADSLSCDASTIYLFTTEPGIATCNGDSCPIQNATGQKEIDALTTKSTLSIVGDNGSYSELTANGEELHLAVDLYNVNSNIDSAYDFYISYFNDIDGNNVYSLADTLLDTKILNVTIPSFSSYTLLDTLSVGPGEGCNIIMVIDSTFNPCLCNSDQIDLHIPLRGNVYEDTICTPNTALLDHITAVNGYSYSWSPSNYLSANNIPQPNITTPSINGLDSTLTYYINIDRMSCSGMDTLNVRLTKGSAPASAMNDTVVCYTDSLLVNAIPASTPSIGYWTVDTANSSGTTINEPNKTNTYVSNLQDVNYIIWNVATPACNILTSDTLMITVDSLPTVNAGTNQSVCINLADTAQLMGSITPTLATSQWRQLSGPSCTFDNIFSTSTTIRSLTQGDYTFELAATNGVCDSVRDTVALTVTGAPTSVIVADTIYGCFSMDSLAVSTGVPINAGEDGVWRETTSTLSFTDDDSTDTYVQGYAANTTYLLEWEVSIPGCSFDIDTLVLIIDSNVFGSAGNDTSLCQSNNSISASALGANYGDVSSAYILWRSVGNNGVTFSDPTDINTVISWSDSGLAQVELSVYSNSCDSLKDTINLTILPAPVSSLPIDSIGFCHSDSMFLNASPIAYYDSGYWVGPATFTNEDSISTAINQLSTGIYTFDWIVSNSNCPSDTSTLTVIVDTSVTITLPPDTTLCVSEPSLTINATITPLTYSSIEWSQVGISSVTFSSTNTLSTTVSGFSDPTPIELVCTVVNGSCDTVTDTIVINLVEEPEASIPTDTLFYCVNETILLIADSTLTANDQAYWINGTDTLGAPDQFEYDVLGLNPGTYTYSWSVYNDFCPHDVDTIVITVADTATADAGNDTIVCESIGSLNLNGSYTPVGASYTWTSLNSSLVSVQNANQINSPVTLNDVGIAEIELMVISSPCDTVRDTVIIDVRGIPDARIISEDTLSLCEGTSTINVLADGTTVGVGDTSYWTYPSGVTANQLSNVEIQFPNVTSSFTVRWNVANDVCGNSIDSTIIISRPTPQALFSVTNDTVCEEECLDVVNESTVSLPSVISDYKWLVDDVETDTNVLPNICLSTSGDYEVSLIVTSNHGCSDTSDLIENIHITKKPTASFVTDPLYDLTLEEDIQLINSSIDYNAYQFIIDTATYYNEDPTVIFSDSGAQEITIIAFNNYCSDTLTGNIYVYEEDFLIFCPTAFTPNKDDFNSYYKPVIGSFIPLNAYAFRIFNRWGQEIFYTNDVDNNGWDGTFNNLPSPIGVYTYTITYKILGSAEAVSMKGHFMLLR